jgi:hypothetical protein
MRYYNKFLLEGESIINHIYIQLLINYFLNIYKILKLKPQIHIFKMTS